MKGNLSLSYCHTADRNQTDISFISESLIIKGRMTQRDKTPEGQSQAMENNSQSTELGPTHRSSNMYLAGIQEYLWTDNCSVPIRCHLYLKWKCLLWLADTCAVILV